VLRNLVATGTSGIYHGIYHNFIHNTFINSVLLVLNRLLHTILLIKEVAVAVTGFVSSSAVAETADNESPTSGREAGTSEGGAGGRSEVSVDGRGSSS